MQCLLSEWGLLSLAFTVKKSNNRSPNDRKWIVPAEQWGAWGGSRGDWAHFLTCQHKTAKRDEREREKTCFKHGSDWRKTKRQKMTKSPRTLSWFVSSFSRNWHIWYIKNDIYKRCPAVNQTVSVPIKFTEFFVGWTSERRRSVRAGVKRLRTLCRK